MRVGRPASQSENSHHLSAPYEHEWLADTQEEFEGADDGSEERDKRKGFMRVGKRGPFMRVGKRGGFMRVGRAGFMRVG